jgi:hypothetical protein
VTDYGKLAVSTNPADLKRDLNLASVVAATGVMLEPEEGRLIGLCPFHLDTTPSFAVWRWEDGGWCCGCWSCSFRTGDLYDYLQALHGVGFREAVRMAVALRDGGELPAVPDIVGRDLTGPRRDFGPIFRRAYEQRDTQLIGQLLTDRGIELPVQWLVDQFSLGTLDGSVLIPHMGGPTVGIVAIRKRTPPDWPKTCLAGSRLTELYGVRRAFHRVVIDRRIRYLADKRDAVICEGESDTWSVAYLLRDECVDVVGLPAGANAGIQFGWLDFLRGRRVTLLFDADDAGRAGAERWASALAPVAASVRVAHLPAGTDATGAGAVAVRRALTEAT